MKIASPIKNTHHGQLDTTPCAPTHSVPAVLLNVLIKAADITRKELARTMNVSDTTVDKWMTGELADPLNRARDVVAMFSKRKRSDLVLAMLAYMAGGDDFDGRVISAEDVAALKVLAKVIK